MSKPIITYKRAVALKLKYYYTGKPCFRGHYAERETETSVCVECKPINHKERKLEVISEKCKITQAINREKKNKRTRERRRENYEEETRKSKEYRAKNREKINKQARERYAANKEKILAHRRAKKEREKGTEAFEERKRREALQKKEYRKKNIEDLRRKGRERYQKKKDERNAQKRARTALCKELRERELDKELDWLNKQFSFRKLTPTEKNRRRYLRSRESRRASAKRYREKRKFQDSPKICDKMKEQARESCRKTRLRNAALLARYAEEIKNQNDIPIHPQTSQSH